MNPPDPLLCGLFLVLAFVLAGLAQTFWLRSRFSRRFAKPLDNHKTFRGKRVFGDHKTWRGFVVMPPAVGAAFVLLQLAIGAGSHETPQGLWPLSLIQYGLLGGWVGLGFMLGELPNSFFKRQFGIPAGQSPDVPRAKTICLIADRCDSVLGGLLALAVIVHVPILTWCLILFVGPVFHGLFSLILFQFGVKARPV